MKAPLSWILDHVDVPAGTTTDEITDRLTLTGLKLEAIESAGRDITGPLVIGRVLTMEPEPQKNGKTINWCTVDVGDANGTGEPQGIVCGAHNFKPGDLVATVLPGGVLPGGFEIGARKTYGHLSAGMICSVPRARARRRPRRHHRAARRRRRARPGRPTGARARRGDHRVRDQPRPRVRPVDPRHRPRGAGVRRGCERLPRPGDPRHPGRQRRRPPGRRRGRRRAARSSSPAQVTGFDPAAPTPDFIVQRITAAGMRPISLAVDVTNYVMLETGRPIHGYDADKLRGAIVVRRARDGERLTTLDGTDRDARPGRPRRHRRLRDHRARRRDGRRDDRDVGHDHLDPRRGGPLGRRVDVPHRPPPQDHLRGGQAQRARRRPDDLRGRGRPRRRAARRARWRPGRPRRHGRRHPAGHARGRGRRRPRGPRLRHADHRGAEHRVPARRRLRGDRVGHALGHAAAVAPRPDRRAGLLRGGHPARRLRPGAVRAAHAAVGSRPHPRPAAAAPGRPHARRRRASSRW